MLLPAALHAQTPAEPRVVGAPASGPATPETGAAPADTATGPCAPWPGEPDPLPDTRDPDPLRARWATLRATELAAAARASREAPARAAALWTHAACLDPQRAAAWRVEARRRPALRVHHPPPAPPGTPLRATAMLDAPLPAPVPAAWPDYAPSPEALRAEGAAPPPPSARPAPASEPRASAPPQPAPVPTRVPEPAPAVAEPAAPAPATPPPATAAAPPSAAETAAGPPDVAAPEAMAMRAPAPGRQPAPEPPPQRSGSERATALLGEAEDALRTARFHDARARASEGLRALGPTGEGTLRGRLELAAGIAELALGRDDVARERFEAALAASPGLRLDPQAHSPKVFGLFEEVRSAGVAP